VSEHRRAFPSADHSSAPLSEPGAVVNGADPLTMLALAPRPTVN